MRQGLGGGWGLEDKSDVVGQSLFAGTALRETYLSRKDWDQNGKRKHLEDKCDVVGQGLFALPSACSLNTADCRAWSEHHIIMYPGYAPLSPVPNKP